MKKDKISKYFKLATVLLIDALFIYLIIGLSRATNSDFAGLGMVVIFISLLAFNFWAIIIYFLTKLIKKHLLRNILFYILLFLSFFIIPFVFGRMIGLF